MLKRKLPIDDVLESKTAFEHFENFLILEHSRENILFWKTAQKYRLLGTRPPESEYPANKLSALRVEQGLALWEIFIKPGAEWEVSLDSHSFNEVKNNIQARAISQFTFASAQEIAYNDMANDSIRRFYPHPEYSQMMEKLLFQLAMSVEQTPDRGLSFESLLDNAIGKDIFRDFIKMHYDNTPDARSLDCYLSLNKITTAVLSDAEVAKLADKLETGFKTTLNHYRREENKESEGTQGTQGAPQSKWQARLQLHTVMVKAADFVPIQSEILKFLKLEAYPTFRKSPGYETVLKEISELASKRQEVHKSFESVIENDELRPVFFKFCKDQAMGEDPEFWLECTKFRITCRKEGPAGVGARFETFFNTFLVPFAPKETDLPHEITQAMLSGPKTADMLDKAQEFVFERMRKNQFQAFLKSQLKESGGSSTGGGQIQIEGVLSDPVLLPGFMQFCSNLASDEDVLFWKAAVLYRSKGLGPRKAEAQRIISHHIQAFAPKEVELPEGLAQRIELAALDAPENLFEEAQKVVLYRLRRMLQPFLDSSEYKTIQKHKRAVSSNIPLVAAGRSASSKRQLSTLSFQTVLTNPTSLAMFMEYARKACVADDVQFWLDVEQYRKLEGVDRTARAVSMYHTYMVPFSPREVEAPEEIHKKIQRVIVSLTKPSPTKPPSSPRSREPSGNIHTPNSSLSNLLNASWGGTPDATLFDEAQKHIFDKLCGKHWAAYRDSKAASGRLVERVPSQSSVLEREPSHPSGLVGERDSSQDSAQRDGEGQDKILVTGPTSAAAATTTTTTTATTTTSTHERVPSKALEDKQAKEDRLRAVVNQYPIEDFLHDKLMLPMLLQFCKTRGFEDPLLFWMSIQEYRAGPDAKRSELLMKIHKEYCAPFAPHEVALDEGLIHHVERCLDEKNKAEDMFDGIEDVLMRLIEIEAYPMFLEDKSPHIQRALAQFLDRLTTLRQEQKQRSLESPAMGSSRVGLFHKVMAHHAMGPALVYYACSQAHGESIHFWQAAQQYKLSPPRALREKAISVYNQFVVPFAHEEVTLQPQLVVEVTRQIQQLNQNPGYEPPRGLYDKAQASALQDILDDKKGYFGQFIESEVYLLFREVFKDFTA